MSAESYRKEVLLLNRLRERTHDPDGRRSTDLPNADEETRTLSAATCSGPDPVERFRIQLFKGKHT